MHILIVDDIVINRIILGEMVSRLGHIHVQAGNGKEALELIQKHSFDLVFMDIEMPVMNGIETIKKIRQLDGKLASVPVVLLTAHNPEDFFEEFGQVDYNDCISKPYLFEKIERVVKKFSTD